MLQKLKQHPWLPVAYAGVLLLCVLSCAWNFGHAVVLAGGDNPLILLEGKMPTWHGVALGIGLASVGADIVKTLSGFLLGAACMNPHLRWPMRLTAIFISLLLVIPTFAWSARSALGMASMVFGDTIAGRNNELAASNSLAAQILSDERRLTWLDGQTSSRLSAQTATHKQAKELRQELKEARNELRSSKSVGAGDPGGQIIAEFTGIKVGRVTAATILLFIVMVEIGSVFGFPALALATRMSRHGDLGRQPEKSKSDARNSDKEKGDPPKSSGGNGKIEYKNGETSFPMAERNLPSPATLHKPVAQAKEVIAENDTWPPYSLDQDELDKLKHPRNRRGRPRHATMVDGHVEEFMQLERDNHDTKGTRGRYKKFCKEVRLQPMPTDSMWSAIKRYRRLGRDTLKRYCDPGPDERSEWQLAS